MHIEFFFFDFFIFYFFLLILMIFDACLDISFLIIPYEFSPATGVSSERTVPVAVEKPEHLILVHWP